MLGRTYDRENCSAVRALEVVGERWSLLIIRNAMFTGSTRFTEFQRALGIAPNILSSRLNLFLEVGLMETRQLASDDETREYLLTRKGLDMQPAIIALSEWGDRWAAPDGPPIFYEHNGCGGRVHQYVRCDSCGQKPDPADVGTAPGPGAWPGQFD